MVTFVTKTLRPNSKRDGLEIDFLHKVFFFLRSDVPSLYIVVQHFSLWANMGIQSGIESPQKLSYTKFY